MTFRNETAGTVILDLIRTIQSNKDYLSEVDGKIGDGDHGINMNKGFTITEEKLGNRAFSMSDGFRVLGETLMEDIGGSMGPLYGVFFEELSLASGKKVRIDEKVFGNMLQNAADAVQELSLIHISCLDIPDRDMAINTSSCFPRLMWLRKCSEMAVQ